VTAWKDLERRVCAALGGRRAGSLGFACSDCVGTPFSVEVKRSARRAVLARWVVQAEEQGAAERRPWLLVVAGHADRRPFAVLDFRLLADLVKRAGLTGSRDQLEFGVDLEALL
jgi:hypothetical protein